MRKHFFFFLLSFLFAGLVRAQTPGVLKIREYGNKNAGNIINEFTEFLCRMLLRIPSANRRLRLSLWR
jgi:hypothetical protein